MCCYWFSSPLYTAWQFHILPLPSLENQQHTRKKNLLSEAFRGCGKKKICPEMKSKQPWFLVLCFEWSFDHSWCNLCWEEISVHRKTHKKSQQFKFETEQNLNLKLNNWGHSWPNGCSSKRYHSLHSNYKVTYSGLFIVLYVTTETFNILSVKFY